MDHDITIEGNDKLRSFPFMTSDLQGQGHVVTSTAAVLGEISSLVCALLITCGKKFPSN